MNDMGDKREVIRDEYGCIDWKANGWPEPNAFGEGDMTDMPHEIRDEWYDICDVLEMIWEET